MYGDDPLTVVIGFLIAFGLFGGLITTLRIMWAIERKRLAQLARQLHDAMIRVDESSFDSDSVRLGIEGHIGDYRFYTSNSDIALVGVHDVPRDPEMIGRRLSRSKLYPLLSLGKGRLSFFPPKRIWDAAEMRKQLTEMSAIADDLRAEAQEERKALLARVKSEDAPSVRAVALAKITSDYPASEEAKEAAASAAGDREAEVRLAAVTVGRGGPAPKDLEPIAFDESAPALTRSRALNALLYATEDEERYDYLSRAFESKSFAVRHVAMLHAIGDAAKNPLARALVKRHLAGFESDRDLRLQAALALGEDGAAHLEALALDDRDAADTLRAKALRGLLHLSDPESRVRIARRALASDAGELQSIAVAELSAAGERLEPLRLREIALAGREPAILAVTAALAKIREPASEAVLIELLERREPSVTIAATRALIAVGGVQSIAPLSAAIARTSDGEVVRFATIAIDLIRERLGATGGALSIAGDESAEGGLSFTEDARGRLGLTGDGGGAISVIVDKPE